MIRWPAEWEPHASTWMAWPHRESDWPGKLPAVRWAFAEMVRMIAQGERVGLLVQDAAHEADARNALTQAHADLSQVDVHPIPTDRGWLRDMGPIVIEWDRHLCLADFGFTGWAKYPDHHLDAAVPHTLAARLFETYHRMTDAGADAVLEGGAVDTNGAGALLTTEECLLDPAVQVRNPGWTRQRYESFFENTLGIDQTIWLGRGIVGDDTHGHVDDCCRFVARDRVVLVHEPDPNDENHIPLAENRERLEGVRLADGSALEVVLLPMPRPLYFDGLRLPASYANFYIANAAVLVPTFNDPADRTALGILADCFPDRPVIGIHAVDLVWGLGTIHCLTQQCPRAPEPHI